jgi:hypothetical protein
VPFVVFVRNLLGDANIQECNEKFSPASPGAQRKEEVSIFHFPINIFQWSSAGSFTEAHQGLLIKHDREMENEKWQMANDKYSPLHLFTSSSFYDPCLFKVR